MTASQMLKEVLAPKFGNDITDVSLHFEAEKAVIYNSKNPRIGRHVLTIKEFDDLFPESVNGQPQPNEE